MTTERLDLIETRRLLLEPLQVDHADEMAVVLGDPHLYHYIGGGPLTPLQLRARYQRLAGGSPDPRCGWLNWVMRLLRDRRLIGMVQATVDLGRTPAAAEIAWMVGAPWQGQGLAKEAVIALVDWLGQQGAEVVTANIHPDHLASAAVARAAGLVVTDEVYSGEQRWRRTLPDGG